MYPLRAMRNMHCCVMQILMAISADFPEADGSFEADANMKGALGLLLIRTSCKECRAGRAASIPCGICDTAPLNVDIMPFWSLSRSETHLGKALKGGIQ